MEILEARKKYCPLVNKKCIADECMFWITNVWTRKTPKGGGCRLI